MTDLNSPVSHIFNTYTICVTLDVCEMLFYGLSAWVGCWSAVFIWRIIYTFLNVYHFDYKAFAVSGKVGIP